jgi:hypothetical protein
MENHLVYTTWRAHKGIYSGNKAFDVIVFDILVKKMDGKSKDKIGL